MSEYQPDIDIDEFFDAAIKRHSHNGNDGCIESMNAMRNKVKRMHPEQQKKVAGFFVELVKSFELLNPFQRSLLAVMLDSSGFVNTHQINELLFQLPADAEEMLKMVNSNHPLADDIKAALNPTPETRLAQAKKVIQELSDDSINARVVN